MKIAVAAVGVCEGRVKTKKKGGPELWLAFCDVFELHGGKKGGRYEENACPVHRPRNTDARAA